MISFIDFIEKARQLFMSDTTLANVQPNLVINNVLWDMVRVSCDSREFSIVRDRVIWRGMIVSVTNSMHGFRICHHADAPQHW